MIDILDNAKDNKEEYINALVQQYYVHYNIMIDNCMKKFKLIKKLVNDIE